LRNGHLEKVYENCLAHRLLKKKVTLRQQYPIDVYDEDGTAIGHFVVDVLVEDRLLVELKACSTLVPEHTAQILGYLRACRLRHAMLINFGAATLQIKKLIL
jgi:GxxExxY protein